MKGFQSFALAAALALASSVADAAPVHRKAAARRAPIMTPHMPVHRTDSYYVPYVTDAAGKPVPIMQIPSSVTVIPQQVMQDQQNITVCDALRNVSGVFCR